MSPTSNPRRLLGVMMTDSKKPPKVVALKAVKNQIAKNNHEDLSEELDRLVRDAKANGVKSYAFVIVHHNGDSANAAGVFEDLRQNYAQLLGEIEMLNDHLRGIVYRGKTPPAKKAGS